ncbi:uncharacterized protein [Lepisosteus oculatus]|uniref:Si:dkey-86e18.1 n=1 Tax=Lepisosteus oculatus TaxID=7918 RepID=W5MR33_LEPOC|nr:PREDICTED: uncharacterized protein LOC102697106 isoform X2 [Lepisosteus oculatus]
MARNEEKQLGKLNRLWLQRQRDEGRLKDIGESRPRLSSLNSPAAVKKWIPSITNEIEYYLQQSQLSHYPERKIAEFQQQIEGLRKEYKSYLHKLRVLDPSCKHQPWNPRGYTKRKRPQDGVPCPSQAEPGSQSDESDSDDEEESKVTQAPEKEKSCTLVLTSPVADLPSQDQPLCFNHSKMAVKVSGQRATLDDQNLDSLARVLFTGLPNLQSCSMAQNSAAQNCLPKNSEALELSTSHLPAEHKPHVLGLDCYSSSEEDT